MSLFSLMLLQFPHNNCRFFHIVTALVLRENMINMKLTIFELHVTAIAPALLFAEKIVFPIQGAWVSV